MLRLVVNLLSLCSYTPTTQQLGLHSHYKFFHKIPQSAADGWDDDDDDDEWVGESAVLDFVFP